MAAATACRKCGTEPLENARFCHGCGSPISEPDTHAEYKQVTVLFADVVHSMEIAAAVGPERLREIMKELVERCAAVVKRYGGTVDKFTGDGVMAVFGAPIALEDHASRACLAALAIQAETQRLAVETHRCDHITLQLRVGLNSGQVITGEIGAGPLGYTAIGEQVGMAQRMESVAPPGGVMLSESTARLVDGALVLGDPEMVRVKGSEQPVRARRLVSIGGGEPARRGESPFVGRTWELNTITGILDEAIHGAGCVVGVAGPAGIGKSRLVREAGAIAKARAVPVFGTNCESHASDIPFHAIARLLRVVTNVEGVDPAAARTQVRHQFPDADRDDLLLLADLLGIRDAAVALPDIAPDARRRRLTALINGATLAQLTAGVYVVEDAQWIDEVSESMLVDFVAVIPQTGSLILITYRPDYRGALSRIAGAPTVALRPLSSAHTAMLTAQLLGTNPSVAGLATTIAERASGNPFFVEEMVRDLSERGVLQGDPGAYRLRGDGGDVDVPATLQATISARIDRLDPSAKRTLNAAAVIGSRFDTELLGSLVDDSDVATLIASEFIDQVRFSVPFEFAFRHPLIRAVAYESQLMSDRAHLHRRLAGTIEQNYPGSVDENASLIAEHLEAAGDLRAAFDWHMRAATWLAFRDITAARTSWRSAQDVADRLPDDDPNRMSMRIAARSLLCGTAYRVSASADTAFDELRQLCAVVGDERSLATGMAGLVLALNINARRREGSRVATDLIRLLDSIGDPMLTVALSSAAFGPKFDTDEIAEVLRMAESVITLAEGDPSKGTLIVISPLSMALASRGVARSCLGISGWHDDVRDAIETAQAIDPALARIGVVWIAYVFTLSNGVLLPDATVVRETAEILSSSEQSGDDLALYLARAARGVVLLHHEGSEREDGFNLLSALREASEKGMSPNPDTEPVVELYVAKEMARRGNLDDAINLARPVVDGYMASRTVIWCAPATAVLVESLLRRGSEGDLRSARKAIERLVALPTDPGFVLNEIWLLRLRALLSRAEGNDASYRALRDDYHAMANSLGFQGHIAWSEAMP
jgi:adenylate cyclase